MTVGELGEIRDHLLEIGAAASSPPPPSDDFAESNHCSRVQSDEAAQPKDSSAQPAELDTSGRSATLERLRPYILMHGRPF